MSMPVWLAKTSDVMCASVPLPLLPAVSPPGRALAWDTRSATDLKLELAGTTSTNPNMLVVGMVILLAGGVAVGYYGVDFFARPLEFKRWLADAALHRPEPKRRRDRRQADIVQALLDEGLLPAEG